MEEIYKNFIKKRIHLSLKDDFERRIEIKLCRRIIGSCCDTRKGREKVEDTVRRHRN